MADKRDYYEVLGVAKKATKDDLKKAFRKLSMKYHPDRQHGKSDSEKKDAEDKFKEIAEAYAVLEDDEKRRQYDQFGFNGSGGFGGQGFDPRDFFRSHASMFGNMFGCNDDFGFGFNPFAGMSGGSSRKVDPNAPKRGQDVRVAININFEDSLYGIHKEFDIKIDDPCEHCHGSGSEDGKRVTCTSCGGSGMVSQMHGPMVMSTTCPTCHGEGSTISKPCTHCNGRGYQKKTHHIDINIPRGVDQGSSLRVPKSGQHGFNGGEAGDLYIKLNVTPNDLFEREGLNLFANVTISPITAFLGGKTDVLTPWGKAEVKINPGTISGKQMRIPGKGVKTGNGETGDMYVTIIVDSLSNLSNEQEKIINELKSTLKPENTRLLDTYNINMNQYIEINKDRMKE